jgi:hypothetical protein
MILPQEDTHRFYRIWLALLSYANAKLQIVSNWPISITSAIRRDRGHTWPDPRSYAVQSGARGP